MRKKETYVIVNNRGDFCCKDNLPYSNKIFFAKDLSNCIHFNSLEEIESFFKWHSEIFGYYTGCLSNNFGIEKITTEIGGIKEWY